MVSGFYLELKIKAFEISQNETSNAFVVCMWLSKKV